VEGLSADERATGVLVGWLGFLMSLDLGVDADADTDGAQVRKGDVGCVDSTETGARCEVSALI
jgi:hypothetical protein